MKMIQYFIADDGKRFEDEDECRNYEFSTTLAPKLANCRAFDSRLRPIELDVDAMLDDRYRAESIYYIYIGDKVGFDTFSELYHNLGYRCPADTRDFNKPVFLHYNTSDEWEDLEEIIRNYQDQVDKMKEQL